MAVYDNKIYIVGGIKNGQTSGTTNMMDEFDPKTRRWASLVDAPHVRDHGNLVVIDKHLVALGGRNSSVHEENNFTAFFNTVVDRIDAYNVETQTWRTLTTRLPAPSAGAGALAMGNTIYYIGGETEHYPALATTYAYNFDSRKWKQYRPLVGGRHGTNAVKIGTKIFIAAGSGNRGGRPELNSLEVLDVSVK